MCLASSASIEEILRWAGSECGSGHGFSDLAGSDRRLSNHLLWSLSSGLSPNRRRMLVGWARGMFCATWAKAARMELSKYKSSGI
jgi:hypothetical protein